MIDQKNEDEGVEQRLARAFAVDRHDVYSEGIADPRTVGDALPVRPHKAMEILGVTEAGLWDLIVSGVLRPPANLGHGRVAWRRDEILMAARRSDV